MRAILVVLTLVLGSSWLYADGPTQRGKIAAPSKPQTWIPAIPEVPAPGANWTGGYVGLHGANDVGLGPEAAWAAGAQVGHNWQWSSGLVLGVEADVAKSWHKDVDTAGYESLKTQIDGIGSVRARVGWAVGPVLGFATAGLGVQSVVFTETIKDQVRDSREWTSAFVWGGGAEVKATDKVSVKAEYLRFEDRGWEFFSSARAVDQELVRLGLNYKF